MHRSGHISLDMKPTMFDPEGRVSSEFVCHLLKDKRDVDAIGGLEPDNPQTTTWGSEV
jgi:hypothetical protein